LSVVFAEWKTRRAYRYVKRLASEVAPTLARCQRDAVPRA
jgi:hypothetical protein